VFAEDNTRTVTSSTNDPESVSAWEFSRHTAWKVNGILDYIINESDPNQMEPSDFADMLEEAAERL